MIDIFDNRLVKIELRDYQQKSIDILYEWMHNNKGNPCLVLPTGSGKSHVIAAFCRGAIQKWPKTKILVLTHVKELIEQNSEKMRHHWPNAPMGIYSSSIGRRELGHSITFAGIQSVRNKAGRIGHVDVILIDECHLVSHKAQGSYRNLIDELTGINPRLRVIGLTATPYRLGHGLITDDPAIFDDLIEPIKVEDLILQGHLAPLRSKVTKTEIDTTGVHKRGGEFIEAELQRAVDKESQNISIVEEVIRLAGNRKSWLFFCSGVQHSINIRNILRERGIKTETITGNTPKAERAKIISMYKDGKIKALTNANVLTTGFDYPDIDLIAMLRPTESPGLYIQMAGRGLRPKTHTDHCLVLDFAGVVLRHGPIIAVEKPKSPTGGGDIPVKECEQCHELVHISIMICPDCGYNFPPPEKDPPKLHEDDILGIEIQEMEIGQWVWNVQESRTTGIPMIKIVYYGSRYSDKPINEYLTLMHDGYAGNKAKQKLSAILYNAKDDSYGDNGEIIAMLNGALNIDALNKICDYMMELDPPTLIRYKMDGKFFVITERTFQYE